MGRDEQSHRVDEYSYTTPEYKHAQFLLRTKAYRRPVNYGDAKRALDHRLLTQGPFKKSMAITMGHSRKLFLMGSFPHFSTCRTYNNLGLCLDRSKEFFRFYYSKESVTCNCSCWYVTRPTIDRTACDKWRFMNHCQVGKSRFIYYLLLLKGWLKDDSAL